MKKETKIEKIIFAFQNAMWDIESLNEFYYRSNKTLLEFKLRNETDYLPGKIIGDLFDEVLDIKGIDERNKKIEEINNIEIVPSIKLSDVCSIAEFTSDDNTLSFSITSKFKNNPSFSPNEAKKKYGHLEKYEYILKESILSHIVVSFENYLANIYRILINSSPLLYFENQTILLADVFKDNFNDAIADKLEAEIDNKMRNSLDGLEHISKKENININRYGNIFEEFKEIYYRRNAYVHTMGCANKDYMQKVCSKYLNGVKDNDILVCDDFYLHNAITVLCKVVFSITYELLVKLNVSEEKIETVANCFFEKLKNKEYDLSKYAFYSLSQYKTISFAQRTAYRMNYINAAKQLNEKDVVEKELKTLDVSIATDDFKIAKECLANNNEIVYKMLQKTYPESFDAVSIREWPIFINFRSTEFYEKFVSEHSEDFDIQQVTLMMNSQNGDDANFVDEEPLTEE